MTYAGTGSYKRPCTSRLCQRFIFAVSVMGISPLCAQQTDPFSSVINRARPEFAKPPITIGSIEIAPRIDLDLEAIDNVFASDAFDRNDVTLSLRPSVLVQDRRADRILTLDLGTSLTTYLDGTFADLVQVNARGQGRFGLGTGTRPYLGFEFRQNDTQNAEFSDLSLTSQPLRLTSLGGNAGIEQEFGPLTATAEGRYLRSEFRGGIVVNAGIVDTAFDSFDVATGRFRLAYSVNPALRFYIEAQANDRRYASNALTGPVMPGLLGDRSSNGFSVRAGFSRQITEILQIDANVGYLRQEFDDPTVDAISSLSFDASLYFSPSPLTRYRLTGARRLDDTINPLFNGLLRTEIGFGVEHELRRDLLLSAEARYSFVNSRDLAGAVSGDIDEAEISGAVRYLITPRWSARLRASYFNREGAFRGTQARALIGIAYLF